MINHEHFSLLQEIGVGGGSPFYVVICNKKVIRKINIAAIYECKRCVWGGAGCNCIVSHIFSTIFVKEISRLKVKHFLWLCV